MNIGFDNEKYQRIQSEHIKERISQFDGKLYLELGGKPRKPRLARFPTRQQAPYVSETKR